MKVFILSTVMAPYRIDVFNELGTLCDLVVCFEQKKDKYRSDKWYKDNINNFKIIKANGWEKKLKNIKFDTIKYLKNEKPDFVIFYEYSTRTARLLMLYCIKNKIKYLINCDGAFIDSRKSLKNSIKRFYIKNATGCLANGKSAEKYFLHYGAQKEKIFFHNFSTLFKKDILDKPLTVEQKNRIRNELKLNDTDRVFICVGNYTDKKGYDLIIKVAGELKNERIKFVNIGWGEKKQEYKSKIEKDKLKNIVFEEFKDKENLKKYYDMSDVFVFPTREDVWGLVVNEAMSRGLPVITTDKCNAGMELVEDNINGELIKAGSYEELLFAIKKYLNKTNNELFKQGKESIKRIQNYTIENIAKSHFEVLEKISEEEK